MPAKFAVQITPNAPRSEIVGWQGDRLKIKIKAPAVEGKANEELIRFLAEFLGLHRRDVSIDQGATSRTKLLSIESMDEETLRQKLQA